MPESSLGSKSRKTPESRSIRRQDRVLGRILVTHHLADWERVKEALEEQKAGGTKERLAEILIRRRAISVDALEKGLRIQQGSKALVCPRCAATFWVTRYKPGRHPCPKIVDGRICGGRLKPKAGPPMEEEIPPEVREAAREPEKRLGKFVLLHQLGRGRLARVFKAFDTKLHRTVAIKFLLSDTDPSEVKRFYREARTAAALKHPNINAIYEVDELEGRHYIAMEFVEGETLSSAHLDPGRVLRVMAEVARAVEYAHSKGVIHRDLKPGNIMIDARGTPFVMDFGLAKRMGDATPLTDTGSILGTPCYMPPEQALAQSDRVDARSDVYSLGATLYELLCGRPPFLGSTWAETLRQVEEEAPEAPSLLAPVPAEVEAIILRCLAKNRDLRYPTARALADELTRVANP